MARTAWLVFALTLIPVTLAPSAIAQAPAPADRLQLGSVELTLGMPENAALTALKRKYHVERARSAGDDWAVSQGTKTLGVASFSAGKLSRASKTWLSTEDRAAASLAGQLYQLAGEFASEGRTQCTLSAKPYRITGAEGRVVTLVCGAKSVQLFQSTLAHGGSAVSLQEVLQ
jgi:hypothetical protein